MIGDYESGSLRVSFDFGEYSDRSFAGHFDGKRVHDASIQATRCDGLPALRAEWHDAPDPHGFVHVVAVYLEDVDRLFDLPTDDALYFSAAYRDAQDAEVARQIVDSVEVRR